MSALVLAPDTALLTLTAGTLLIYLELNRPGLIFPGAFGLAAALIAIASLARLHHIAEATASISLGFAGAAYSLRRDLHRRLFGLPAVLIMAGCCKVPGVHWPVAWACGIVLGTATMALARIARRARLNKGLD